jgi:hypothetical protein|tara:strand:- start:307 stop:531 length:225 start_codon:yes stop_codon:yes gene_type:complete
MISEIRVCNVCSTKDEYENMIMNIEEILECSEQRITEWQSQNPNIDLHDWFCISCCEKIGNKLEVSEEQGVNND